MNRFIRFGTLKRMGGRVTRIVALISLLALIVAWALGSYRSFLFQFITPAGHLQVLATDRTGLVLFLSDIPFGPEMGLTGDVWMIPASDAEWIHELVFMESVNEKWAHFGVHWSNYSEDLMPYSRQAHCRALLIPYWMLIGLLLTIFSPMTIGAFARRRSRRQGRCVKCGYDLRHSTEQCPECGTARVPAPKVSTPLRSLVLRQLQLTRLLIAGILIALVVLLRPDPPSRAEVEAKRNHGAKLDQNVTEFIVSKMPFDQAMKQLDALAGTRIIISKRGPQTSMNWFEHSGPQVWQTHVTGEFRNVPVSTIVKTLANQVTEIASQVTEFEPRDDGTIFIGSDDEMEFVVRIYDLRPQYTLLKNNAGNDTKQLGEAIMSLFGEYTPVVGGRLIRIAPWRKQQLTEALVRQFHQITEPWPKQTPFELDDGPNAR